jgi:hypothetical protein
MTILNNEITTPIQAKNGSRSFLCSRTGHVYTSYASGYVRRQKSKYHTPTVLNKRIKLSAVCFGIPYEYMGCEMIDSETDRLELIKRRSVNFKQRIK